MRILLLVSAAIALLSSGVGAQPQNDAERHRSDCRIAVQVVASGRPVANQDWALSRLRSCGTDAGRVLAEILPRLANSTDTVRLNRHFSPTREIHDGQIFRVAMTLAADRRASAQARVFALRSLIWSGVPGRILSYADLAGDKNGRTSCAGGFTTHVSLSAGTPLPSDYDAQVRNLASRLAADPSEPIEVRRAARCAGFTEKSIWLPQWLGRQNQP
jgi:hypothetical protein